MEHYRLDAEGSQRVKRRARQTELSSVAPTSMARSRISLKPARIVPEIPMPVLSAALPMNVYSPAAVGVP
jgi:hypothetical protein